MNIFSFAFGHWISFREILKPFVHFSSVLSFSSWFVGGLSYVGYGSLIDACLILPYCRWPICSLMAFGWVGLNLNVVLLLDFSCSKSFSCILALLTAL